MHKLTPRQAAKLVGHGTYEAAANCLKCNTATRFTASGNCVACAKVSRQVLLCDPVKAEAVKLQNRARQTKFREARKLAELLG